MSETQTPTLTAAEGPTATQPPARRKVHRGGFDAAPMHGPTQDTPSQALLARRHPRHARRPPCSHPR